MLMLIDITMKITPKMLADARGNEKKELVGHLGTHFDVMNQAFPLEYTERKGIVFDVSYVTSRDIEAADIDLEKIEKDMFVAFYSGFSEKEEYGSTVYFTQHPQLSDDLIEALLEKKISIIGVDFAGVRRGKEHTLKDLYCAQKGVFIVENLCNLNLILEKGASFVASTYPMNCVGISGLPCRVIAKI